MSGPTLDREHPVRRAPLSVLVSAWAVPIMIVGQFAMLAIVPVALVLISTLRDTRLKALRWGAIALTAAYATPLALWAIGPERAQSLSKDMHPVFAAIIVTVGLALAVAYPVLRRKALQAPVPTPSSSHGHPRPDLDQRNIRDTRRPQPSVDQGHTTKPGG